MARCLNVLCFFSLLLFALSAVSYDRSCENAVMQTISILYDRWTSPSERFNFLVQKLKMDSATANIMERIIEKLNYMLMNDTQLVKEAATQTNLLIFAPAPCWEQTLQSHIKFIIKNGTLDEAKRLKSINDMIENEIISLTGK